VIDGESNADAGAHGYSADCGTFYIDMVQQRSQVISEALKPEIFRPADRLSFPVTARIPNDKVM
jgi:hypothetical protein